MQHRWPAPLLQMMLLLTAMLGCKLGLSAAPWVQQYFVPVRVQYGRHSILGLLSKHARDSDQTSFQHMFSAGRHPLGGPYSGMDLVLVDPAKRTPVGLLPDFYDDDMTLDQFTERRGILYDWLVIAELE